MEPLTGVRHGLVGLRGYGKYAVVYFIVRGCGCCFLTVGEGQIDIPKFLVVSKYIPLARTTYYTPHVIFKWVLLKKMDVLKGEEGKRVASGGRHFRPTSGERLCRVP